jgi:uncharacterized RDD family membrane protein YckC
LESNFKFVGFWQRVWMSVIDDVLLLVYALILMLFRVYVLKIRDNSDGDYIYTYSLMTVIPFIITFLFYKYKGGTPGKIARKVKIIDVKTGGHPTDKQFFLRLIGLIVSGYSFLLSYIHIGLDSRKQAWHDKLSGTTVIHTKDIEDYKNSVKCKHTIKDKKRLKIEMYIFAFFILLFITFKFFQYYDEPINPKSTKWMYKATIEEEPEINGFYYLAGFYCLEDENPIQKGIEWVNEENKKITEKYNLQKLNYEDFETNDLAIIFDKLNVADKENILDYYVSKANLIDSLEYSYSFLIERYRKISSFTHFHRTLIPHYEIREPIIMSLVSLKRLNLASIGKEFRIGDKQKALKDLFCEIQFSRFMLRNTDAIVSKLAAEICFELDLQLLSNIIDESTFKEIKFLLPKSLSASEKNWKQMAITNFNTSLSSNTQFQNPEFLKANTNGRIAALLFRLKVKRRLKLNKLINEVYNSSNYMYNLSLMNAKDFIEHKNDYPEFEINWWDQIFDPVGSIMSATAIPIYQGYIAKFHDIDGYINMLKLKAMIKDYRLNSLEIQSFIEAQSDSLFNPYSEKSIKWNSEKSVLYLDTLYDEKSRLKEVKIEF